MKKWLIGVERFPGLKVDFGLLGVRVFFGLSMALAHGLGKLPPPEKFVGYVASMGVPFPGIMAWGASISEFIGGILIALGLATIFWALTWIGTMGVAAFVAHANDPFQKKEMALAYLVVAVFLFLAGPGKHSIDNIISKD